MFASDMIFIQHWSWWESREHPTAW